MIRRAKIGLDFCSVFSRLLCSNWIVLRACEELCINYIAWTVSVETSGEIGERVVVTISVTIVMDFPITIYIMVSHEDCVSKAGV